jgi:TRAP-type uncharacterized transport system substrate-binding protein
MNRSVLALCSIVLLASAPVLAQTSEHRASGTTVGNSARQLREKMRDEVNAGLVGLISPGVEGTELAASLDGARDHLRVLPIAGTGASQTATDIVFARGIDLGIIGADVLAELKRDPPFPGIDRYLQYITKLYDEEVHVLARSDIQSVEDLAAKKVNFGLVDSQSYITARITFLALGIPVESTSFPHNIALEKLRQGEISALVYLVGKPSPLFQGIGSDDHLHFLAIRAPGDLPPIYTPGVLSADDYPKLVEKNAPVTTVALGTVLVAYNWPAGTERHRKVARFVDAFFNRLHDLQAPPYHPKWREIDPGASISGWTRFLPAEQWIRKAGLNQNELPQGSPRYAVAKESTTVLQAEERAAIFKEFVDFQRRLTHQQASGAGTYDRDTREALFREFAEYQKRQSPAAPFQQRSPRSLLAKSADYPILR